jgi:DNA polymerase III epsilon subunit-like protein
MIEFRGQQYDIVTLDFETFYEKDYTLTTMPTSAYVRDPRFLAQMVGIKINDGPTEIYCYKKIRQALCKINWKRSLLLCHNTAFDGFVLSQKYRIKPAGYLDTLSMARAVLGHGVKHRLDNVGKLLGLGGKQGSDSLAAAKGQRHLDEQLLLRMAA